MIALAGIGRLLAGLPWRRIIAVLAVVAAVVALVGYIYSAGHTAGRDHERPISFAKGKTAGASEKDAEWRKAMVAAKAAADADEAARQARWATIQQKKDQDHANDLAAQRAAYDRLRRKLAQAAAAGAGGSGQDQTPDPAGGGAGPGEPVDPVVAAPLGLIEEGDRYRLQVMLWQDWWARVVAENKE